MTPAVLGSIVMVGSAVSAFASVSAWLVEPKFRMSWMLAGTLPAVVLFTVLWTFKASGVY